MRYGIDRPVTQAAVVPEEVMSQVEPLSKSSFSVDEVLNNYLKLKCTYKDDSKEAANAKELYTTFNNLKADKIEAKFKKSMLILPMMPKNMQNTLGIIQDK
jgi:hypothetical protein